MTDDIDTADKPFANPEPSPLSASERLRAFQDEHLGVDAQRHGADIERGRGAPIYGLSDELQKKHAALEKLVAAEQQLNAAEGSVSTAENALAEAQANYDAALAAAE